MDTVTKKRGSYRTGRERVERILDAAHELFIVQGYRATSLRDIARESGISHPALLRHFSSKAEILTALIERLDAESAERWGRRTAESGEAPSAAAIAKAGRDVPGWIELFTALLGEATSPSHPGHALMLARRREGAKLATESFARLGVDSAKAERELRQLVAGWEGMQILTLYFPDEIDLIAQLERHPMLINEARTDFAPILVDVAQDPPEPSSIVAAAARQYAEHGYYETTMQAVADDAGITRAALIHVAPTKRSLLDLVLAELFGGAADESEILSLARRARSITAAEVVLICEATVPTHPANAFVRERLSGARSSVHALLVEQRVPDPAFEADWIVAASLGILIAWLYEPGRIQPGSMLHAVVARVRSQVHA